MQLFCLRCRLRQQTVFCLRCTNQCKRLGWTSRQNSSRPANPPTNLAAVLHILAAVASLQRQTDPPPYSLPFGLDSHSNIGLPRTECSMPVLTNRGKKSIVNCEHFCVPKFDQHAGQKLDTTVWRLAIDWPRPHRRQRGRRTDDTGARAHALYFARVFGD